MTVVEERAASFVRPDGREKVTGTGRYTADLTLSGQLHAAFRYADHPHARIVRIGGTHVPKTVKKWLGDSVGHWEGDTLVVETTNFTDNTRFMGSTDTLRVVERFTRVDARTLRYQFTVEDPKTWTRPWTAEYTWPLTNDLMYEYACHEGNYGMSGLLSGTREEERKAAGGKR